MTDTEPLPAFPYHPDPVGTGSVAPSDAPCACCGLRRGYAYTGPVFSAADLSDPLCPWCIADGSAAERYEAQFTEVDGRDVPMEVVHAVERRTPGFSGWQQERWLSHCGDAAVFLGYVRPRAAVVAGRPGDPRGGPRRGLPGRAGCRRSADGVPLPLSALRTPPGLRGLHVRPAA
ncbi:CbrC family protein [Streptomyces sp. NBC_01352]|uniref:CbrC family protein n=1 Tax=Streptomyces sp. NBC_01352 TaxID=2903834 RepID=UPI002E3127B7|nr:CbrC family protein [Streptomyces sp. NBC_01352]